MLSVFYTAYEAHHIAVSPFRELGRFAYDRIEEAPALLGSSALGTLVGGALDIFCHVTERFDRPDFGISQLQSHGDRVEVREKIVAQHPFVDLVRFEHRHSARNPKTLIVAPLSGHYATLLRDTVRTLLPDLDIHITDWKNARDIPLSDGTFDLDDYVGYVIECLRALGPGTHVIAVCQPVVPVLAAVALMSAAKEPAVPASMTLMGGPIDPRRNPTVVNRFADTHDLDWFRRHVIATVPFTHSGHGRPVYPGFLQLLAFILLNPSRHWNAHREMFAHLIVGDGDSAAAHRKFYEEYRAVMDLPAEYYLQSIDTVFKTFALPERKWRWRGQLVDTRAVETTALMTIEGGRDELSAPGQTSAAHELCANLLERQRERLVQPDVGHYGIFNGRRWRRDIAPRLRAFIERAAA